MKSRFMFLAALGLFSLFVTAGDRLSAQQPPPAAAQHQMQMPSHDAMMAENAKIDDLLKKMNAATGAAKTEAMAALLTALVDHHKACSQMMMGDMSAMPMMGGAGTTQAPK